VSVFHRFHRSFPTFSRTVTLKSKRFYLCVSHLEIAFPGTATPKVYKPAILLAPSAHPVHHPKSIESTVEQQQWV
jgi:hypothetical protein